jgi:hypothetical protein
VGETVSQQKLEWSVRPMRESMRSIDLSMAFRCQIWHGVGSAGGGSKADIQKTENVHVVCMSSSHPTKCRRPTFSGDLQESVPIRMRPKQAAQPYVT